MTRFAPYTLALALGVPGLASAAPVVGVSGACPGVVDFDVSNLGAGAAFTVLAGPNTGATVVPAGACAGTVLDIATPGIMRLGPDSIPADGTGARSFSSAVPAAGCGYAVQVLDLDMCEASNTARVASSTEVTFAWDLLGLEPLAGGFVYEGWLIISGAPVSTGRFNVDASGLADLTSFQLPIADMANVEAFVLTIEPGAGDLPDPSGTKLMSADWADPGTPLAVTVAGAAAFGDDFTSASGTYILNTPTTAADDTDYSQGIWFFDPGTFMPSVALPVLPAGWRYEGWVVDVGGPVSTGRFSVTDLADEDGAGPTAGPDGFPPFPGQDYIFPAIDLIGQTVVISVEPEPDDSPAPFLLKPLVDDIVVDMGIGGAQSMGNNAAATNPTGMVWFE